MRRTMIGLIWLLGLAPAFAAAPSDQAPAPGDRPMVTPDKRADSSVPSSGVIQPTPEAGHGSTVRPPNVDPGMTVAPPGTPGGNPSVDPK